MDLKYPERNLSFGKFWGNSDVLLYFYVSVMLIFGTVLDMSKLNSNATFDFYCDNQTTLLQQISENYMPSFNSILFCKCQNSEMASKTSKGVNVKSMKL